MSGTVRDAQSNAAAPGIGVQIVGGPDTDRSTATDASGSYSFTGLKVGNLTLRFAGPGFEIAERVIAASQDTRLDVPLRRGPSCMALPAPTGFRAVYNTTRGVTFSWTAVAGIREYVVYAGRSPGTAEALSRGTAQTTLIWRNHATGTYYARVASRGDCAHVNESSEVTVVIAGS